MPTSAPTTAPLDLVQLTTHIDYVSQAISARYRRDDSKPKKVVDELSALQQALRQLRDVETWTGKEPPRLCAVEALLRHGQRALAGGEHQSGQADERVSDPRRDSARVVEKRRSTHDEFGLLESHASQCTVLVQKLNFATILSAACSDAEGLTSSITRSPRSQRPEKELISIVEGLVKLRYGALRAESHTIQGHAAHRQRQGSVADLEVELHTKLQDLARWAGLELHSASQVTVSTLGSLSAREYRKAVMSVEGNAAREDVAFTSATPDFAHTRPVSEDCSVTIKLDNHRDREAARFRMEKHKCTWFDEQDTIILEHKFPSRAGPMHPWRHPMEHSSLTVAFTDQDMKGCIITCPDGRHEDHKNDAPDYVFDDIKGYATFQSALTNRTFVTEYGVSSIKAQNLEKCPAQFVKIWKHPMTRSVLITIPLAVRSAEGYGIKHEEVEVAKVQYERVSTKSAKLVIKQNHEQAIDSSSTSSSQSPSPSASPSPGPKPRRASNLLRKLTSPLSGTNSPEPGTSTPSSLEKKHQHFTLEFRSSNDRDEFGKLFKPPPTSVPASRTPDQLSKLPTSNRSLPELRLGPPALSQSSPIPSTVARPPSDILDKGIDDSSPVDPDSQVLCEIRLPEPIAHDLLRDGGPQLPPRVTAPIQYGTTKFPSYHQPLTSPNEFRILRIVRGTGPGICCYLDHHDLSNPPKYEALSYCWGGGSSDKVDQISNGDLSGYVVSEHLWRALWRLRLKSRDRLVWIDAICINQANVDEKNIQISLMRRIYATAFRTIIWIGDLEPERRTCPRCESDEDDSELTLCTLQDLSALEHDNVFDGLIQELVELKDYDDKTGQAKVWWKRLWCVQEFYYSPRTPSVYLGPHAIGWKHFQSLFDFEKNPLSLFQRQQEAEQATLYGLLSKTGEFLCSDPRDRVFALLGMIDQSSLTFVPDYRHSVLRVLEDSCMYLLAQTNTLDVLLDKRQDRTRWGRTSVENVIPTWIPDLTRLFQEGSVRGPDGYIAGIASRNNPEKLTAKLSGLQTWTIDGRQYDVPRALHCDVVYFDTIVKRSTAHDIPAFEETPDGCLIYNSLRERGHIIESILNTLEYDFKIYESFAEEHDLDINPGIGRLMLDYLFHGKRSTVEEIERIAKGPKRDIITSYIHQRQQDLNYLSHESKTRDVSNDKKHVKERYKTKIDRAESEKIFVPERFQSAYNSNNRSIQRDFNVARDIGNLFAYARTSGKRYYLTRENFDAPMRRDVLECKNMAEVELLPTQFLSRGEGLEFHEYVEHHRERDLFKTRNGFLGLGPSSLQEGDEIVVAMGASRPLILRKSVDGSHHSLVGSAVVPGIMSGKWAKFQKHTATKYAIR